MKVFKQGQSLAELAIVLVLLISAFAAMQIYVQRGISSKIKVLTNAFIGNSQVEFIGNSTESSGSTSTNSAITVNMAIGGTVTKGFTERTVSKSLVNSQI